MKGCSAFLTYTRCQLCSIKFSHEEVRTYRLEFLQEVLERAVVAYRVSGSKHLLGQLLVNLV